jgi:hypothetical protein
VAEFHFNEGAFEIPGAGVRDRSMTALEIDVGPGRPVSLVVTRQARLADQKLEDVLTDTLKALGVSLRRFKGGTPKKEEIGGFRAVTFDMTWVHETGPMYHRVTLVELEDVILTVTSAAMDDQKAHVEKVHSTAVSSLKFRRKR